MIHTIYLSIKNILINQIPNFYHLFKRCDTRCIYSFKYKNIRFYYFKMSKSLLIQTEVDRVLNRYNITLDDKNEFIDKLTNIILEVVNINKEDIIFNVCRCDYKVDLQLSSLEMQNIFILLNKHRTKYKYIKSTTVYDTSISLTNRSASYKINIYNKGCQCNIPEFDNVLRVELQLKNKKIHSLYKKLGIERDIDLYWSKEFMEKYFFKYFEDYLYIGNYYKLTKAIELIINSNYSNTIKNRLIEFIKLVQQYGMTEVSKKFSYNTVRRYITFLNNISVNPICISDDSTIDEIPNILTRIIDIANKEYLNSNKNERS